MHCTLLSTRLHGCKPERVATLIIIFCIDIICILHVCVITAWPNDSGHNMWVSEWVRDGDEACPEPCPNTAGFHEGYFFFIIKVCQLDYSYSSILCQNTNIERSREIERESMEKDGEWPKKDRTMEPHIIWIFPLTDSQRCGECSLGSQMIHRADFYINC